MIGRRVLDHVPVTGFLDRTFVSVPTGQAVLCVHHRPGSAPLGIVNGRNRLVPIGAALHYLRLFIHDKIINRQIVRVLPGRAGHGALQIDPKQVRGERVEKKEDKGKNYLRMERRYGGFARTVPLPSTVDADKAEAEYKDGVLHVRLPRREGARPKRIEVKT